MKTLIVDMDQAGLRLDSFMASVDKKYSRSIWKKLIDQGYVTVDGEKVNGKQILRVNAEIAVTEPEAVVQPDLPIIYEDDDVLVINKPAGLLTHLKSDLESEPTIAGFIADRTTAGGGNRAGIVHRLDRATSGLILAAKTDEARIFMTKQFSNRRVQKWYLAVVKGDLEEEYYHIDRSISRSYNKPSQFRVVVTGKTAITDVYRLFHSQSYSVVLLKPLTGRTHQLRVHMSSLGYPIIGDPFYSKKYSVEKTPNMMLHAWQLEATLPSNERPRLIADIPESMSEYLTDDIRDRAQTIVASQQYQQA